MLPLSSPNLNRFSAGELHGGRDPCHDGQEEEHPKHVRHRARRSRKVDADRLVGQQGGDYRRSQGRRDPFHGHQEGRAGKVHHHQVDVSTVFEVILINTCT